MIKDTIEFRMRRSDDEREPRKLVWNNRLTADHDTVMTVVTILTKLIERGVPTTRLCSALSRWPIRFFRACLSAAGQQWRRRLKRGTMIGGLGL
jgi:hypothetical protein